MNEYANVKLTELRKNVHEMLDNMSSIRYVVRAIGIDDGRWYADMVFDYIDDASVPKNIEEHFADLVPGNTIITWDYYEICRDSQGEVTLKTYLRDVDIMHRG